MHPTHVPAVLALGAVEDVPASQLVHPVEAGAVEYLPAPQLVHVADETAFATAEYLPGSHEEHAPAMFREYFPASQSLHADAPLAENVPALQVEQELFPSSE